MVLKEYKIGDICIISAGGDAPLNAFSKNKTSEFSVPIYSNGVVDEGLYGYTNSAKIKDPAITLSARGTIGISFRRFEPYFPIVRLISLVIKDTQIVDIDYLYYASKFLHIEKDGSVQQQLTIPQVSELRVKLPDLPTQKKIAKVLSDIDAKLSLNRRINERLEQVARQLYDYWFVQFDFPDANGNPYRTLGGKMIYNDQLKREIPEGWEIKKIASVLNKVTTTYKVPTKEYLREGKYPIIDQSTDTYFAGWSNNDDAVVKQYPVVVFGDHSCAVKYVNMNFCRGADGTQLLFSDTIPTEYLYFSVLETHISPGYARHFSFLKESPIIVPDTKYLSKYKNQTQILFETITHNKLENIRLTALRDRLLPLLMNGQVTIKE